MDGEVLGLISQCLSSEVGVQVLSQDPEKLRQRLLRTLQKLPERPSISLLTRHTAQGPALWLVKSEFMNGKKFDAEAAIARLRLLPHPCEGEEGDTG